MYSKENNFSVQRKAIFRRTLHNRHCSLAGIENKFFGHLKILEWTNLDEINSAKSSLFVQFGMFNLSGALCTDEKIRLYWLCLISFIPEMVFFYIENSFMRTIGTSYATVF